MKPIAILSNRMCARTTDAVYYNDQQLIYNFDAMCVWDLALFFSSSRLLSLSH